MQRLQLLMSAISQIIEPFRTTSYDNAKLSCRTRLHDGIGVNRCCCLIFRAVSYQVLVYRCLNRGPVRLRVIVNIAPADMQSQLLAHLTCSSLRGQALRQINQITSLSSCLCLIQGKQCSHACSITRALKSTCDHILCFAGTQQLPSLQLWYRQMHVDASTSPAALAAWVQEQGGSVEKVNVQPAGGGAGYGLWSSQVHTAQPAPFNLDRPSQTNLHFMQELQPGLCLVRLPRQCQLTYDSHTQPDLLELIEEVPSALWGARLALQVMTHCLSCNHFAMLQYALCAICHGHYAAAGMKAH